MSFRIKKFFTPVSLAAIIFLYLFFGLHHLGQFLTADEHYWLDGRISQYWEAWETKQWKKTLINDKPGVTLALASFPAYFVEKNENICSRTPEKILTCDTIRAQKMLEAYRFPIVIINGLFIVLIFWLIRKLTKNEIALWAVFFIALTPQLIGISQIVNPDAFLWSTSAISIFSYLNSLKYQEKKYVILSGIFLGLALLSKYSSSILIPFFSLVFIAKEIFREDEEESRNITRRGRVLFSLLGIYGIALSVLLFLLPAAWINPSVLQQILSGGSEYPLIFLTVVPFCILLFDTFFLRGLFLSLLCSLYKKVNYIPKLKYFIPGSLAAIFVSLIVGRMIFPHWEIFSEIPFDLKDITSSLDGIYVYHNFFQFLVLEANPLVFSLPIIFVLLLFFQCCRMVFSKKGTEWDFLLLFGQAFILINIIVYIMMDVLAIPRYFLILFPIVSFLAAIEVSFIRQSLLKNKFFPRSLFIMIFILFFMTVPIFSLYSSSPFYLNYTNALLSKDKIVSDSWGYGGYEAAEYLNSLPDAENLLVWSDYEGVCQFFKGRCIMRQYKFAASKKIDYAVISRRGGILYDPNNVRWTEANHLFMKPAYDNDHPDWIIKIGGRAENFVKVVKVE